MNLKQFLVLIILGIALIQAYKPHEKDSETNIASHNQQIDRDENIQQHHKSMKIHNIKVTQEVTLVLKSKFVTSNQYPIRNGKVYLKCGNDQEGPLQPDVNGDLLLSLSVYTQESQIKCKVILTLGYGQIQEEYEVIFDEKDKFQMAKTFTFTPQKVSIIETKACVHDKKNQGLDKVQVKLVYTSGKIFMNERKMETGKDGCFDVKDSVQIIDNNVKTQLTVSKEGYKLQQINLEADSSSLKQIFQSPIVLDFSNFATIEVGAEIIDQYNQPLDEAKGSLTCLDSKQSVTFKDSYSDVVGKLTIFNDSQLKIGSEYKCKLTISKDSELYNTVVKELTLIYSESFTKHLGKIQLKQQPTECSLEGNTEDQNRQTLGGVDLKFSCNDPNVLLKQMKSDNNGYFMLKFSGYKGREYDLNVTASKDHYFNAQFQNSAILNMKNNYKLALPQDSIELQYIPQPVQGFITGIIYVLPEKIPGNQVPVEFEMVPKPASILQNPIKTNEKGFFNFTFNGYDIATYKATLKIADIDYAFSTPETALLDMQNHFTQSMGSMLIIRQNLTSISKGKLVDDYNNPVQGAQLSLTVQRIESSKKFESSVQAVSNKDGDFELKVVVEAGYVYSANLEVKAQYFQDYYNNQMQIQKSNSYTADYKTLQISRKQKEGEIKGFCLDEEDNSKVEIGKLSIKSITPKIKQMPLPSACNEKDGSYSFSVIIADGVDYSGVIVYDDQNKKFVNDEFKFNLTLKDKYDLNKFNLIISPGVIFRVSGTVYTYRGQKIENASLTLSMNYQKLSPTSQKSDKKGAYSLQEQLVVKSIKESEVEGVISISAPRFKPATLKVKFEKDKNYKILDFDIVLMAQEVSKTLTGKVVDNLKNPLSLVFLQIFQLDLQNEIQLISWTYKVEKDGSFSLPVQVSPDYDYYIQAESMYCINKKVSFMIDAEQDDLLKPDTLYIQMERYTAKLIIKGHITNSFYEPITNALFSLNFDQQSLDNGAQHFIDTQIGKQWFVTLSQTVFQGFSYKGSISVQAENYLYYNQNIVFDYSNGYQIVLSDIVIEKQKVNSLVSGQVSIANKPVQNANIQLLFSEGVISKQQFVTRTDKNGYFKFEQKLEQDYYYNAIILVRSPEVNDSQTSIQLNSKNDYTNNNLVIQLDNNLKKIVGSISGQVFRVDGTPVSNCQIQLISTSLNISKSSTTTTTKSDANGSFSLQNISVIDGNMFDIQLAFAPAKEQNLQSVNEMVILSVANSYNIFGLNVILAPQMGTLKINGVVVSADSDKLKIVNAQVYLRYSNQKFAQNGFAISDIDGKFLLQNEQTIGSEISPSLYVSCDGYKSYYIANLELVFDSKTNEYLPKQVQAGKQLIIALEHSSAEQLQTMHISYGNFGTQYVVQGRAISLDNCSFFSQFPIKFAKVSLFFYYENLNEEKYLMAETYADMEGFFNLKFNKATANVMLEIKYEGYITKHIFARMDNERLGDIELVKLNGVPDTCDSRINSVGLKVNEEYGF